jgi:hypothetical protein
VSAEAPPTKAKRAPAKRRPAAIEQKAHAEAELIRWTPEEVVKLRLLPYSSVRVLKDKCYKRKVHHHNDGGRITFTADDLRRENERTAVVPLAA